MRRLPAKVLGPADVRLLLKHVTGQRYPERNRVMVLLSFKAGMRACEIAGLSWPMILGSDHSLSSQVVVGNDIAKGGSGRAIPMHADLKRALKALHRLERRPRSGNVIRSERGARLSAGSVVNWFAQAYRELGMIGCSSHSGRRTFITDSARLLAQTGGSLRDIQELAGHRSLTTTERYIQGNRDAQRKLIRLL
ncbi:tyrosine-type recombinase/integrase [Sphingomonas mesophila]|uniref:tyrosine-type recombinase/integrase n=1 Tax=Sphingomonas mesophila TaxID=2303576 RepID=UPI000E578AEE|nr:site-specific integrase [Sphingomonas mesophila]